MASAPIALSPRLVLQNRRAGVSAGGLCHCGYPVGVCAGAADATAATPSVSPLALPMPLRLPRRCRRPEYTILRLLLTSARTSPRLAPSPWIKAPPPGGVTIHGNQRVGRARSPAPPATQHRASPHLGGRHRCPAGRDRNRTRAPHAPGAGVAAVSSATAVRAEHQQGECLPDRPLRISP